MCPQHKFLWRSKKNIMTFLLKKSAVAGNSEQLVSGCADWIGFEFFCIQNNACW